MENTDSKIFLYSGKQIISTLSDGMYRATVEGRNYCSGSLSGLIDALSFFHSIYITTDTVPAPKRPEAVILGELLASNITVEQKQSAFKILDALASKGDTVAVDVVSKIKSKPVSFGASIITKWAGVKDFAEVSPITISDMVGDIVHKAELLNELADRISLKSFSSKE